MILVVVGLLFLTTYSLRLEMGLEWNFGMMSGVGIILLSVCFLELFKISSVKEAYVALMQFLNGVLYWDLEFLRAIQDWELESLYIFWDAIYGVLLSGIGEDKMCGTPTKSRGFEVSNYY